MRNVAKGLPPFAILAGDLPEVSTRSPQSTKPRGYRSDPDFIGRGRARSRQLYINLVERMEATERREGLEENLQADVQVSLGALGRGYVTYGDKVSYKRCGAVITAG